LTSAVRYMMPLLLLFSIFVLLRGHNEPGGGFIGGLVAAAAFSLYAIAFNVSEARRLLRISPIRLIAVGLLTAVSSGFIELIANQRPFMTSWWGPKIGALGKLSSPLIFDTGVYITVIGVTLLIIYTLAEE